jgi:hypothetical protein
MPLQALRQLQALQGFPVCEKLFLPLHRQNNMFNPKKLKNNGLLNERFDEWCINYSKERVRKKERV